MIKDITHRGKNYILVYTSFKVEREGNSIIAPVHIRIDITDLSEKNRATMYKKAYSVFNHELVVKDKRSVSPKKPWWRVLFN